MLSNNSPEWILGQFGLMCAALRKEIHALIAKTEVDYVQTGDIDRLLLVYGLEYELRSLNPNDFCHTISIETLLESARQRVQPYYSSKGDLLKKKQQQLEFIRLRHQIGLEAKANTEEKVDILEVLATKKPNLEAEEALLERSNESKRMGCATKALSYEDPQASLREHAKHSLCQEAERLSAIANSLTEKDSKNCKAIRKLLAIYAKKIDGVALTSEEHQQQFTLAKYAKVENFSWRDARRVHDELKDCLLHSARERKELSERDVLDVAIHRGHGSFQPLRELNSHEQLRLNNIVRLIEQLRNAAIRLGDGPEVEIIHEVIPILEKKKNKEELTSDESQLIQRFEAQFEMRQLRKVKAQLCDGPEGEVVDALIHVYKKLRNNDVLTEDDCKLKEGFEHDGSYSTYGIRFR